MQAESLPIFPDKHVFARKRKGPMDAVPKLSADDCADSATGNRLGQIADTLRGMAPCYLAGIEAALLCAAMDRLYLKGLAEADVFESEPSESTSEDGSSESSDSEHSCIMADDGAEAVMFDNPSGVQEPSVASSFKEFRRIAKLIARSFGWHGLIPVSLGQSKEKLGQSGIRCAPGFNRV